MLYRLKITGPVDISETRRRADAALLCAERMAWGSLEGQGLLDTPAGWHAMDRVRAIDPRAGGDAPVGRYYLFVTPSH